MAKKINVKGPIVDNDTGLIYHWIGFECCCPRDIEKALQEAAGEDVVLEINSPGGYCDMGSEIYTLLREYEGNVAAHIICATSAATVISCGADKVLMSDTGVYMIHNAKNSVSGDYRDMFSNGDALVAYNESIVNAYVRKTGKSREDLHEMMDYTTWMSAEKAIENGFADGYLLGDPNDKADKNDDEKKNDIPQNGFGIQAVNTVVPIIDKKKALEIMAAMNLKKNKDMDDFNLQGATEALKSMLLDYETENVSGGVALPTVNTAMEGKTTDQQNDSVIKDTVSDKEKEKGGKSMTLEELFAEHPDAKAENDNQVQALVDAAREEGAKAENARLKELDAIAKSVSPEALEEAKYGENPKDAKTLAFEAMVADGEKAQKYMDDAQQDAKDSGAEDVGSAPLDDDSANDEADELAKHVNASATRR